MAAIGMVMFQSAVAKASDIRQSASTLKSEMEVIHKELGINFVYDSSLDIDKPYSGVPMATVLRNHRDDAGKALEECLKALFHDTGIGYDIMRKYVVLTHKDRKRKPKDYTIFIEEQHDTLNESRITAYSDRKVSRSQTGLERLDSKKFDRGFAFMSSPDVIKILQNIPGVTGGTELMSGLHVYGGDGNDNLFLLDGVPMYQVSHLAGLFSSFNADMIDNVDFYKSGFPARYGGRMSSVVDVTTRDGDFHRYHGTFSLGLLDGRLQFEGPIVKGKTSFNLGLRRSWMDVLTTPMFALINRFSDAEENFNGGYAFWDANAKVTHRFSDDSKLYANFYMGRDNLYFKVTQDESDYLEDGTVDTREELNSRMGFNWGNIVASLRWDKKISSSLFADASLFYSRNRSMFGVKAESIYEWNNVEENCIQKNYASNYEENVSPVNDIGFKADFDWYPGKAHHVRFGASYTTHLYRPSRSFSSYTDAYDVVSESSASDSNAYNCFEPSVYIEDEMNLADWFEANVGLRYVMFAVNHNNWHRVEPRLSMNFKFTPKVSLKMAYTEMNQFSHLVASTYIDLPYNMWMPTTEVIAPSKARQLSGGLYVGLPHNMHLNVEGWYKTMDNLYEYGSTSSSLYPSLMLWETAFRKGKGRAWGGSVDFGYRTEKTDVTASYTLSWSQRNFEAFHHGWYPDRNDHRHRVNITASHRFTKRFDAYIGWNWRKGSRITTHSHIDPDTGTLYYSEPNNLQMPDYHRLDIGFNFRKTTKRGNESIWNLSFYNAYCRMNPFVAMVALEYDDIYNENWADFRPVKYRPTGYVYGIIPIVPTFSYTLKF